MELTHQSLDVLAKYFREEIGSCAVHEEGRFGESCALCGYTECHHTQSWDSKPILHSTTTPVRGRSRQARGAGEQERREMLSTLGYCARQLDLRAIKKFRLETIAPEFKESANIPSPDGAA